MQKLHLVGFTAEFDGLIFSPRKGAKSGSFVVPIDGHLLRQLAEAERRRDGGGAPEVEEPRAGSPRLVRPESALSPREMQERIRSGWTLDEVATEAGADHDWVRRFAAPVLAEVRQVVERARDAVFEKARVGASSLPLGASVRRNVLERGVRIAEEDLDDAWSAYQLADAVWVVRFAYTSRGRVQQAEWVYDLETEELTSRNRLASQLGYAPRRSRRQVAPAPVRPPAPPPAARKPARRKAVARKAPARKAATRKPAVKKAPARKPAVKKAPARKAAVKKAPARKAAVKKAPAKRAAVKKAPAKRAAVKKAPAKRAAVKKAPARKVTAKKAPAKRATASSAVSRRATTARPPAPTPPRRTPPASRAPGPRSPAAGRARAAVSTPAQARPRTTAATRRPAPAPTPAVRPRATGRRKAAPVPATPEKERTPAPVAPGVPDRPIPNWRAPSAPPPAPTGGDLAPPVPGATEVDPVTGIARIDSRRLSHFVSGPGARQPVFRGDVARAGAAADGQPPRRPRRSQPLRGR